MNTAKINFKKTLRLGAVELREGTTFQKDFSLNKEFTQFRNFNNFDVDFKTNILVEIN